MSSEDNKKSFILYTEYKETFDALSDEQAGKLIKYIFKYVNGDAGKLDDKALQLAFIPIKQNLQRDLEKWKIKQQQRKDAGRKSAEARKKQRKSTAVSDRQRTSTVNVNGNVNGNGKKRFTPPSLNEVIKYFKENGFSKDLAKRAFEHYKLADWHDSRGNPVKNWKQKMRTVWMTGNGKAAKPLKVGKQSTGDYNDD